MILNPKIIQIMSALAHNIIKWYKHGKFICWFMTGKKGFEPPTYGFEDQRSTVELLS